ncbi:NAD(P)/FAD-dependent oxidoreductase [Sphingobium lactosutens]|uniref:FAD-dependent pyridine nucleotide-disulfide oxidoreductase n=1 Tax=Sphingobium lactosutens DS20 TaxID=1331060 RepID=T0HF24_9SPHN|nr:FAD-dependent oxidoreductase [Sphingobium lactosutens]EQB14951.1 hypothetical protein RLDS_12330 [Sphingobium lactosutens DS20]
MNIRFDTLIVGGGHAGAQVAIALRQRKYEGTVAIAGEESFLPYERPPLSKEYLAGEKNFERLLIRPKAFWDERNIEILLGHKAVAVDPEAQEVRFAQGVTIRYGELVWATGGHARSLSCEGDGLEGIHTVRNLHDVDQMLADIFKVEDVVVIGGGYIGLEAAAALSKFGKKVTILEALGRVLARVTGPELSRYVEDKHRSHGIDVRLGASVASIEGTDGKVSGVRLTDGTTVAAQMVIVGIGIVPAVQPLIDVGAAVAAGAPVNDYCQTALPHIWAVGDCALHHNKFAGGGQMRIESVQNANDMATIAAKGILGTPERYENVPWFWSNQYDMRLQTVGILGGYDEELVRGDPKTESFSVIYRRKGKVVAIDTVNAMKDYVQGKMLVTDGFLLDAADLTDATRPLKDVVASHCAKTNIRSIKKALDDEG